MRGKRFFARISNQPPGITPADAGKTKINLGPEGTVKDHPRRCGENQDELLRKAVKNGSPPQVRGKLGYRFFNDVGKRITPADAGKTRRQSRKSVTARDHPRGCGENSSRAAL